MPTEREKGIVTSGYDSVAAAYAALERPGHEWPRLRLLRDLLALLPQRSSVLDLGCGNGVPALREIARAHRAVGADISQRQVELARANVPEAEIVQGDAAALSFPPGSFDAVAAFYLLDHLPRGEHRALFAKVREWLVPGGLFVFSIEPDDEPAAIREWLGKPMFFSHFDAGTTLALVRQAGFTVLDSHSEVQVEGESEVEFLWVLAQTRAGS